jgi:hypothetical protein
MNIGIAAREPFIPWSVGSCAARKVTIVSSSTTRSFSYINCTPLVLFLLNLSSSLSLSLTPFLTTLVYVHPSQCPLYSPSHRHRHLHSYTLDKPNAPLPLYHLPSPPRPPSSQSSTPLRLLLHNLYTRANKAARITRGTRHTAISLTHQGEKRVPTHPLSHFPVYSGPTILSQWTSPTRKLAWTSRTSGPEPNRRLPQRRLRSWTMLVLKLQRPRT